MDDMTKMIAEMGIQLTTLAAKGTANAVNTKIKSIRTSKELDETRRQYEEIITELLADRDDAIRIAMTYKNELERLEISDDDIVYLHNTISNALDLLNSFSPTNKLPKEQVDSIKALISKDTLKSMQLLGFNYRKAIGEPLTNCCATLIEKRLINNKTNNTKNKR